MFWDSQRGYSALDHLDVMFSVLEFPRQFCNHSKFHVDYHSKPEARDRGRDVTAVFLQQSEDKEPPPDFPFNQSFDEGVFRVFGDEEGQREGESSRSHSHEHSD